MPPPYALTDYQAAMQDHGFLDMATTRMTELLNDAYNDVCSRELWPFLDKVATANTVSGTQAVTLPSDFRTMRACVIEANSQVIRPIREDDARKRFAGQQTFQGTPAYYWFTGGGTASAGHGQDASLNLWPVPDAVYAVTFLYSGYPAALSAGTDVPIIPDRHQRVVLLGALCQAYQLEDELDMASQLERQFEKRLQTMRQDLWLKQVDEPDRVYDLYTYDDYYIF